MNVPGRRMTWGIDATLVWLNMERTNSHIFSVWVVIFYMSRTEFCYITVSAKIEKIKNEQNLLSICLQIVSQYLHLQNKRVSITFSKKFHRVEYELLARCSTCVPWTCWFLSARFLTAHRLASRDRLACRSTTCCLCLCVCIVYLWQYVPTICSR